MAVRAEEIDAINIYWAGCSRCGGLSTGSKLAPQHLLIDAKRLKEATIPRQAIIKGDAKSASIAAASILAKVSRDALMRTLDECHPATVLPITRVILCVPTTSLCPGLAPAQPIEGRSDSARGAGFAAVAALVDALGTSPRGRNARGLTGLIRGRSGGCFAGGRGDGHLMALAECE